MIKEKNKLNFIKIKNIYASTDVIKKVKDKAQNLRKHMSSNPEKAMAPHSSTPAWKIPWTEEPGRLQSMGSLRVRHD